MDGSWGTIFCMAGGRSQRHVLDHLNDTEDPFVSVVQVDEGGSLDLVWADVTTPQSSITGA